MHHQPLFLQCSFLSCVLCYKQALGLFLHSTRRVYFYTAQGGSRGPKEAKAMLSWHSH